MAEEQEQVAELEDPEVAGLVHLMRTEAAVELGYSGTARVTEVAEQVAEWA